MLRVLRAHPFSLGVVAAGTAAAVLAVSFARADRGADPAAAPSVPVRVASVHFTPAEAVSRFAAVIQPRVEASVGFRVGGKLTERLVEIGDRVEAGTPLARLDPADLELQAKSVEAQLAAAQADAANARADFARYAALQQGGWTTRQEYEKRRTAADTAEAKARQMEAEFRVVRDNVHYATLTADGPGVVTAALAEPGQVLSQGEPVFRIARLGAMEAVADLSEQDIARLPGADLAVELWALPGMTLTGTVREVSPIADATTRTYRAKIALADPPPAVQLGMTATLVVRRPGSGSVALLPATALTQNDGAPALLLLNAAGDGLSLRPVRVAAYAGDQVAVAGGVAEGDRVVTAGVQKLDPGQKVRVWTEPVR